MTILEPRRHHARNFGPSNSADPATSPIAIGTEHFPRNRHDSWRNAREAKHATASQRRYSVDDPAVIFDNESRN